MFIRVKNKKGFTMIELLAVIIIVGLLLLIAVPAINKQLNSFRVNYYSKLESSVKAAGQDYISDKKFAKPTKLLYSKVISIKDLQNGKYIDEVVDYAGEACDIDNSYVVVVKTGDKDYEYHTCLKCDYDEYETKKPEGKTDYCDPAWLNNGGVEYEYSSPGSELFYVYYGTSEEKIKEKVGLTYDVVKKNDKDEVIMRAEGDPTNKDDILYPVNIGELVGTNVNDIIDLKYKLPDDTELTRKAVIYRHKAPIVTTVYAKDNIVTNKKVGDSYGYSNDEWAGKLKVSISFSNDDFEEVLNNVKIKGAEYYDSSTNKWVDTGCVVNGRTCEWTIATNFKKDVKIRVINEDGNKGEESSEYVLRVDSTSPTCSYNNGNTTWAKSKTVTQNCSDMLSGCSQVSFSMTYPTNKEKNKRFGEIAIYDNAGNEVKCAANFYVDSTPPSSCVATMTSGGSSVSNGGKATSDITFSATGTDNETDASGIKTTTWVVKQGSTDKGQLTDTNSLNNGTYSITPTCTDKAGNVTVGETKTATLYKSFTVSYDCNGGSGCPGNQTKEFNVDLTLSSTKPTRSNYTFVGWGSSASDTSSDYSAGGTYKNNSGIKLYAIWKRTLTFTFNANGASINATSKSCDIYNATTSCSITLPTITRSGFSITGFNSSASSTTAASGWGSGSKVSVSASTASTWYAITSRKISITFTNNGGSSGGATKTCTIQNSATNCSITSPAITAPSNTPTVVGWGDSANATESSWAVSTKKNVSSNDEFFAITKKGAVTRKASFNLNGATGTAPAAKECTISATYNGTAQGTSCNVSLPSNSGTYTGKTFNGWSTSSSASSGTAAGTTVSLSSNKTYYATWKNNSYTITYNLNGGTNSPSNPSSYIYGAGVGSFANPTRSGYIFGGWYSDSGFSTKVTSISSSATGNKTLYAKWTANKPSVSFSYTSGYVCPSNNDGTNDRSTRSTHCHNGIYYNRMQIRNGSYNKSTGIVSFEWRLTMNDWATSWEGGGSAKVCIAKVGSTSCYSGSLGSYNFNSGSWLSPGKSTSWKSVTVDVSNYPAGNYKVISSGDGSFSFSKLDYTNRTFFTVS